MFRLSVLLVVLMISSISWGQEPSGSWRGSWQSTTSGHHGPMRATITPRSDGKYDARFTGRFAVIIPFTYRVTMTPVDSGPCGVTMVANKRMPLFGDYRMVATVSNQSFQARYNSQKDVGVFNMQRSR